MENEKDLVVQPHRHTAEESEKERPADDTLAGQEREDSSAAVASELPPDLPAAYRKLLQEKQELYERLLRKQAELENFRKRLQREKESFLQHANADLLRALLPTLDGFERALKHRDASVPEQFYEGMEMIYRELLEVLGRAGVTPIETANQHFDPHLHQTVETVEASGVRDQEIVEELQRGYRLKHRVLRPAIVKVAVATPRGGQQPQSVEPAPPGESKQ